MNEENNSYVYLHRLVETNKVFYVGLGRGKRMYSRHGRSKPWMKIVQENDWYYTVVKSNMSRNEAAELEVSLIKIYNPHGNVARSKMEPRSLSSDLNFLQDNYLYDESVPSCLKHKIDNNNINKNKKRVSGQMAGSFNSNNGRYTVHCNGRNIFAHRVIWYLVTGDDPVGFVIDHIDGDPLNNKINNLRKVTNADNNKNVKLKKNNSSGYKGVSLIRNKYYCATYKYNNEDYTKHFTIDKFGRELSLALAVEYRFRKMQELVHLGENYTERHIGRYSKLPILEKFSEVEILEMFNDDLCIKNKSGKTGISFLSCKGNDFWVVSINRKKTNFSVTKFGNNLAKNLAFEYLNRYEGSEHKSVQGYSLNDTNIMLANKTRASNISGFHGVTFYVQSGSTSARAQKVSNGKHYSKSFNCNKMGITCALHSALKWLKEFNKE